MTAMPDAIILAGGAGLRLKSITGNTPKPMAMIGGRPFLELLILQLRRHGFSRVILSVGLAQEAISEHFGKAAFGLDLCYSLESSPLGTGGGLRQASDHITTDTALVMNGDSYTNVELNRLVSAHLESRADLTMVVIQGTRHDAGSVLMDKNGRVTTFAEKRFVQDSAYLSAGIYILDKNLVKSIPPGSKFSLEEQLFPEWLAKGKNIMAFVSASQCIDIGTPGRFAQAQDLLASVEQDGTLLRNEELS
jgi:NDP-sugar pyrophosphorylase family protein